MLNIVREGEEDYIEAIRYRRRLKIFENFLFIEAFGFCVQSAPHQRHCDKIGNLVSCIHL